MKPTQWVPTIMAAECLVGFGFAWYAGEWGKAIYWLGGMVLNMGLALQ